MRITSLLSVALTLVLTSSVSATQQTLYAPSASYPTIQDAIDATVSGDTVVVLDGIHQGPGNVDLSIIQKSITLRSEHGPAKCTLLGGGGRILTVSAFALGGNLSLIEGFTFTNGSPPLGAQGGGAVWTNNSIATIHNCNFFSNGADDFNMVGGAYLGRGSQDKLRNCSFFGNTAVFGGAVGLVGSGASAANLLVENCTFGGNFATHGIPQLGGGAVEIVNAVPPSIATFVNCIVWGNDPAVNQIEAPTGVASVRYSAITPDLFTKYPGVGNLFLDPLFVNLPGGDLHIDFNSPCIDAGDPSLFAWPAETEIDREARSSLSTDIGADELYDCNSNGVLDYQEAAGVNNFAENGNSVSSKGALLTASGSLSVAANDLVLHVAGLPSNSPGQFIFSADKKDAPYTPFLKAIKNPVKRLGIVQSNAAGVVSFHLDLTALPPQWQISSGDTRYFQFWYRDPTDPASPNGTNFSDAIGLTFCN